MHLNKKLIETVLSQIEAASRAVLDIYAASDLKVEYKKDNSPLTLADKTSHSIIAAALAKYYPGLPLISEEAKKAPYAIRKNWPYFWLLDPIDGTKEFIIKNGQFTINLALIKENYPVLGVVSLPARGVNYFAAAGLGAFKKEKGKKIKKLKARKKANKTVIITRSRAHKNKKEEGILAKLSPAKVIFAGSSLKFCLVAEGKADIYLRSGPTMEWDTASGQVIASEAGAKTCSFSGEPFVYNKKSLLNPGLICTADQRLLEKIGLASG